MSPGTRRAREGSPRGPSRARLLAIGALGAIIFAAACSNPQAGQLREPGDGVPPAGYAWHEGFESGYPGSPWKLGGAGAAAVAASSSAKAGASSLAFDSRSLWQGEEASLGLEVAVEAASNLRFWLRTDIGGTIATEFVFTLDGVESGRWSGLDGSWIAVDSLLAPGTHRLAWSLVRGSNSYYPSATNRVYLDEVSLCPDVAASVAIEPAATQQLAVGNSLQYRASALRADGSLQSGARVAWELVSGASVTLGTEGLVRGIAAGRSELRAVSGDVASAASVVEVIPADYLDLPLSYRGSTYSGKTSAGSGSPMLLSSSPVSISSPQSRSFEADGYFTLRGTVTGGGASQYALVDLVKDGGKADEYSTWFVRGDFALRIWLRFGAGAYSINVFPLTLTDNNLNYEGDIGGYSHGSAAYRFAVTNVRDEDGRLTYPSDPLQSDDLAIVNLAAGILRGKSGAGERERLAAIHDYVVSHLHYDDASLEKGFRKKQDALSAIANGTAVCEGYTSLFGALARAAGFEVKAAMGDAYSGGAWGLHAWNLVLYEGAWRMVDCTWDDPGPYDADPSHIAYTYFLVAGPEGTLGDHRWTSDRPSRDLAAGTAPVSDPLRGFGCYPAGTY